MTTRLPNKRYIGDGVYAGYDGYQITLETSDGISVTNRIGLESNTLHGLNKYVDYTQKFYDNNQHQVTPGCEDCGQDIMDQRNPIPGTILGEVYQVEHDNVHHEIRLCKNCANSVDQASLVNIIERRHTQTQ